MIWQQSNAFIGFYSPFKVLSSTKKVSNCVTFARDMGEFEIIVLEELMPSHLTRANLLWRFEICQILMIRSDQELLLCSQKEISKCFYSINDSKQFPIIDVIIALCW